MSRILFLIEGNYCDQKQDYLVMKNTDNFYLRLNTFDLNKINQFYGIRIYFKPSITVIILNL